MTRQEFYDKYGSELVFFSSYYKFIFSFKADLPDGSVIVVNYGGNSDEIYRFELDAAHTLYTIESLEPYSGSVYKDGVEIDSFYDY